MPNISPPEMMAPASMLQVLQRQNQRLIEEKAALIAELEKVRVERDYQAQWLKTLCLNVHMFEHGYPDTDTPEVLFGHPEQEQQAA